MSDLAKEVANTLNKSRGAFVLGNLRLYYRARVDGSVVFVNGFYAKNTDGSKARRTSINAVMTSFLRFTSGIAAQTGIIIRLDMFNGISAACTPAKCGFKLIGRREPVGEIDMTVSHYDESTPLYKYVCWESDVRADSVCQLND